MQTSGAVVFAPDVPGDLDHAPLIREEAFDWLDTHHPGVLSFTSGKVLRMAGEQKCRWLVGRLRDKGIGNETEFSVPATADALTVMFLRSRDVKFREAVNAVAAKTGPSPGQEPKYGGVWNRLIVVGLDRLRRRVPARLLGSAVSSLLRDPKDHLNCLVIVKRHGSTAEAKASDKASPVDHDYVYRTVVERPAPSCSVIAPSREVLFLDDDQLPARAEVTARRFVGLYVSTGREVYELLLGTMRPVSVSLDALTLEFVGRILDIVFLDFEEFYRTQSSSRLDTATEPEPGSANDLQLWLITQLLDTAYPGSLCEVMETPEASYRASLLASSVVKPWEPSLWEPPTSLEMLSGYASRVAVPLVVETVEHPWTLVIKSVEPEMRYLRGRATDDRFPDEFAALALPITLSSGNSIGALYMLMPKHDWLRLEVEVRILTVFSRILGETIERQRAAVHSANVSASIATLAILKPEQFKAGLLDLLGEKAAEIRKNEHLQRDVRLPFLLLSAHRPDPDEVDPAVSDRLKNWLVETMRYMDWRSFVRSHWSGAPEQYGAASFVGELPGVGMIIGLDKLVSKDELDRIRKAFPTTINRTSPTNAPVRLLAYVLDVPAQRILEAADGQDLESLADDVERWAFDVATVVDDVAESFKLAREQGEWDASLRMVRRALRKEGGRTNAYLHRLVAQHPSNEG